MSSSNPQSIADVVRNVLARDREAHGLPSATDEEAAEEALLEIARLARRR